MISIPFFDDFALLSQYDQNSVEREILLALQNSPQTYSYRSVDELKFELSLRREIVAASRELYRSGMGFAVFEQTKANPDFWTITSNGGFRQKEGVKGSAAISDIFINGRQYATECATAMVIVYYKALLNLLGAERFDALFGNIYLMNWDIQEPLLREVGTPRSVAQHLIGDRAYFNNPDVSPDVPWWQGENVIVLPDSLYYGHGIGIQPADGIIRVLNSQRKEDATQSAYLMNTAARPSFRKLFDATRRSAPVSSPIVWLPFPPPITSRA